MSNFSSRLVAVSFALVLFAIWVVPGVAQINAGSLNGVVTDSQGAAISGAQVTAVNVSTHTTYVGNSNEDGVYTILSLPSGTYDVTIKHEGFNVLTDQAILLASGENKKLDVRLTVGQVREEVTVSGAAPALETREGAYSVGEGTQTLAQLPLEISGGKRDATQYMTGLPGYQKGNGFSNQVFGSVGGYSEVYVDGTPQEINAAAHGATRNFFSAEGVEEIKVVATPMADLGNVGGAAISFITKSGTNQLHGSAYGFIRNTALDATCDFFCSKKQDDHQGEYGFSLGGPVDIPHVYNGRNKTFWWFNWGHFYYTFSNPDFFSTVPTDAMKNGDFSAFLGPQIGTDPLGNPVYQGEIYDPNTTTVVGGQINRTPYGSGGSLNMIPGAAFSSVASKYQTFFPEPTSSNLPSAGSNYHTSGATGSSPDTYYQIDIDQNIGSADKISGTYWYDNATPIHPLPMPAFFETFSQFPDIGHFVHLNWTHLFTPNLVHEVAFGFDRNFENVTGPSASLTGAVAIGQVNALGSCTPGLNIAGGYMASNGGLNCAQAEGDNNFAINDNWSLAKGKHLLKWGFNLMRLNANFPHLSNMNAGIVAAETSLPDSAGCPTCATQTGLPYASFLIGAVDNAAVQGRYESNTRVLQYGFYAQDEFKLTRKLTVTYGLRYDVQPFPVQRHNYWSEFLPNQPNPGCNGCLGAVGFLGFGPGTLNKRSPVPTEYFSTNFYPKFGFAYQVFPNTVVRGAATLAGGPINQTMAGMANVFQQGYFPSFSTASPDGISPAFSLDNGYPLPNIPLYNNFDSTIANGSGTGFFGSTSNRAPRVLNTSFGIEHQFPGRVVVGINYNGTYVHGLIYLGGQSINQLDYGKYASYGQSCLGSDISNAAANCPGKAIALPYAGFTGTVGQALRPFPQYGDIDNEGATNGFSTYSSGSITAKKDYSDGLSFLVGYTLSRQFTDVGTPPGFANTHNVAGTPGMFAQTPQDAYSRAGEKAPATTDIPQRLLFNYTYPLPFGRGRHFNTNSRALDAVVGGWSVAGIHTYTGGSPITIASNTSLFSQPATVTSVSFVRPNLVPGVSPRTNISCGSFNPARDTYLNSAAFVMPGPLQFGNAPRALGSARTCPYFNENITLYKNFHMGEKVNFRFGADFFNIFNRHILGPPNANVQDANFGKIHGLVGKPRSIQFNGRITF